MCLDILQAFWILILHEAEWITYVFCLLIYRNMQGVVFIDIAYSSLICYFHF
jgi:hypothetical protein